MSEIFVLHKGNRKLATGEEKPEAPKGTPLLLRRILVAIFVVLLAVGLIAGGIAYRNFSIFNALESTGVEVEGAFLGGTSNLTQNNRTVYQVTYEYQADGRRYEGRVRNVPERLFNNASPGQPAQVIYLPDRPVVSTLVDYNRPPVALLTFSIVWTLVVVLGLGGGLWYLWRRVRLGRESIIVAGEIKGIEAEEINHEDGEPERPLDPITHRHGYRITVEYEFDQPNTGRKLRGTGTNIRNDLRDEPLPGPGTPVSIRYVNAGLHEIL